MFLKKITLTNFRNYSALDFNFSSPVTVLAGNNAQGKSNFLESIYYLSTTKSPKADSDVEMIKRGEDVMRIQGIIDSAEGEVELEIAMQRIDDALSKRVKVNGVPRRVIDYIGNLSVVSFSPEDINLVNGSPSLRRWHIDLTLAGIDREYKNALTSYEEVVTSKNRVLKRIREGQGRVDELTFWSDKQLETGAIVSQKRQELFDFLNTTEKKFGDFSFEYLPSPISRERLEQYGNREIASASSLIGPHRDDFVFKLDDRDLSKFGSRGEHRTAVLDLKISESSFIEKKTNARPILLLDDVFSELDEKHQEHVVNLVSLQQTVIATVDLSDKVKDQLRGAVIINVDQGQFSLS
jgi:DNA replication and repair protein RecF